LKAAIHRGEADIADLVELVELLHDHLTDLTRGNFALAEAEHLLHDALDRLVDIFRRHWTLVQRPLKAVAYPTHVEVRARAILLHDLRQSQLGRLVGSETLLAGEAAPAAPDRIAAFRHARIEHLGVGTAAEGTLHRCTIRGSAFAFGIHRKPGGQLLDRSRDARDGGRVGRRLEHIGHEVAQGFAFDFGEPARRDCGTADAN